MQKRWQPATGVRWRKGRTEHKPLRFPLQGAGRNHKDRRQGECPGEIFQGSPPAREILERQLDYRRMVQALRRMASCDIKVLEPPHATPLAFPVMVNRLRARVTSGTLSERIPRMALRLEKAAKRDTDERHHDSTPQEPLDPVSVASRFLEGGKKPWSSSIPTLEKERSSGPLVCPCREGPRREIWSAFPS